MKKIKFVILFTFLLTFFIACRPVVNLQEPKSYVMKDGKISFSADFESFWNGINNNYALWAIDPTDWDAVYSTYKPKFAAIDTLLSADYATNLPQAKQTAYDHYKEMTKNLIDGHFVLSFTDNAFDSIRPIFKRVKDRFAPGIKEDNLLLTDWSSNDPTDLKKYNFADGVIKNYINTDYLKVFDSRIGKLATGIINTSSGGKILYFYFSNFTLKSSIWQEIANPVLNYVLNTLKDVELEGVIIDVRWNQGGVTADLDHLWGRMIESDLIPMETRVKSGEGRLDYMPWVPFRLPAAPLEQGRMKSIGVPIVLLTNKLSMSCAEMSSIIVKAMKNGTVIGEQTYGATCGTSNDNTLLNSGTFTAADLFYAHVNMGAIMTRDRDGITFEGKGIPPDIEVALDWTKFLDPNQTDRKDTQLEAAIKHIDPNK